MQIVQLRLDPEAGWAGMEWPAVSPELNVAYGPHRSGKTTVWQFLAHVLFGHNQRQDPPSKRLAAPQGNIIVRHADNHFRLRRCRDAAGETRLTVAAEDGAPVDHNTVRTLLHGLTPRVLSGLYAVSFDTVPDIRQLLNAEFAREIESICGRLGGEGNSRRLTELAARRDVLAKELETRIAGERRASQELDGRWQELDRRVREEQQHVTSVEQRLRAVDAALAETDARLRYRRLELNTQLRLLADGTADSEAERDELDNQITRWRATLSELSQREAALRAKLAQIRPGTQSASPAALDQGAWLAMLRQLAADLAGEVARLARASESRQCVCRDAHPRLRPISESIQRQLDLLQTMLEEQSEARQVAAIQRELEQLCRAQDEMRRHVERLLDQRQMLTHTAIPAQSPGAHALTHNDEDAPYNRSRNEALSAVDAEQLEQRRLELEEERYEITERLRAHVGKLRDLRARRDTAQRQRAALLSARSIEHVQRELADVQRKLQSASAGIEESTASLRHVDNPVRASDFLAQLTDGQLVRLMLVESGRSACVVNRAGETLGIGSLAAAERDQVYLSLCLALVTSAAQHGLALPLVLDDPFSRLGATGTAALATVLGDFCRQGHQVLLFTGRHEAAERLASVGAAVNDMATLRQTQTEAVDSNSAESGETMHGKTESPARIKGRAVYSKKRRKKSTTPLNGKSTHSDQSDAA